MYIYIFCHRLKLLEKDDVTRYIRNIVEEIFQISSTIIQYKASEEKAYSYSVEWARQLMLETIEVSKIK